LTTPALSAGNNGRSANLKVLKPLLPKHLAPVFYLEDAIMKERPILFSGEFSGEMVRAILDGRKTQTRRVVKNLDLIQYTTDGVPGFEDEAGDHHETVEACPHGKPGDHLWVRETYGLSKSNPTGKNVVYAADGNDRVSGWTPSIHMPRWASRITLGVTGIRVERLQEISEQDAIAEGLLAWQSNALEPVYYGVSLADVWEEDPRLTYKRLWNTIYTERGHSWDSNPWVWVIDFSVIKA
jgi:hypothetical protein